jgi:hypothetical protein
MKAPCVPCVSCVSFVSFVPFVAFVAFVAFVPFVPCVPFVAFVAFVPCVPFVDRLIRMQSGALEAQPLRDPAAVFIFLLAHPFQIYTRRVDIFVAERLLDLDETPSFLAYHARKGVARLV